MYTAVTSFTGKVEHDPQAILFYGGFVGDNN